MKNKFLPIGSIITYKKIDMMITGYFPIISIENNQKKYKDYLCCIYPTGVKDNKLYMVDLEEVEKVKFIGYQSPRQNRFLEKLFEVKGLYKKNMSDEEIIAYMNSKKEG